MADSRKLGFGPIAAPAGGVLVVFADDGVKLGPKTKRLLGSAADLVVRAAKNERFTGKGGSTLDIVAPGGLKATRLIVIGTGKADDRKPSDVVKPSIIQTRRPSPPMTRYGSRSNLRNGAASCTRAPISR